MAVDDYQRGRDDEKAARDATWQSVLRAAETRGEARGRALERRELWHLLEPVVTAIAAGTSRDPV